MMLKRIIFIAYFVFFTVISFAQNSTNAKGSSQYIIRSTLGVNGLSKTINTNTATYFVQQSIGQASVIGTYSKNGYTIRQGFLQPLSSGIKVQSVLENNPENNLKVVLYPNPFQQSINISINEYIINDVSIVIYNISGKIVFSEKHFESQLINISLDYLPKGDYIIKITTENKQFVSKLIKY